MNTVTKEDLKLFNKTSNKSILADFVLLGILGNVPVKENGKGTYEERLKKAFKFEIEKGDIKLRSLIDIIEDTECAIADFFAFGLKTPKGTFGEMYLRLFGILNTIYIQLLAIIELIELFKIPEKKEFTSELKKLKIFEVRNKLGSHVSNYFDNGRSSAFKISRPTLNKWGDEIGIVPDFGDYEEINLLELVKEYNVVSERILINITKKALDSLFPNNSKYKEWLNDRYDFAKNRNFEYTIFIKK
jgi:hypothetical protein